MLTREGKGFVKRLDQVVAAVFFNEVSARDAIADPEASWF